MKMLNDTEVFNLEKFLVEQAPADAFYVPDFITEDEEDQLMKHVYAAPKPKWTQLSNRRLQNWGGLPHAKGMVAEKIPAWLDKYLVKLHKMQLFEEKKPNHVLVNEYLPGQGIMPHVDGPLFYPTITTINLGSHTILDFYKQLESEEETNNITETSLQSRYIGSFLLERRSLVCFKQDMYEVYMHGIEDCIKDDLSMKTILNKEVIAQKNDSECITRSTRISLTIRHFPKTLNVKLKFGIR